jgi:LPS-assembly protein
VGDESLPYLDSTVRLTKAWQSYNLTTLVRSTQDLTVPSNDITLQRYPEITLSGIKQRLFGTPLYYELSGVYDYFYRGTGQKGQLTDVYPTLSMPFSFGDYLQVTPFSGVRSLVWHRDDDVADGAGKDGNREVYVAGATVSSEAHRVFAVGGKSLDSLRHAIRPEVTYVYSPYTRQDNLPDFVAAATQQNTANTTLNQILNIQNNGGAIPVLTSDQNSITYSLTNTLMARYKEKDGKRYAEILRLKLAQTYNIKESNRDAIADGANRRPLSDINVELDFKPVPYLSFSARNIFSVYNATWTQANYDLGLSDKRGDSATVTYRYTQNTIEETNLILKGQVTKELALNFRIKRDNLNQREIEKIYGLDYRRQCWTIGIDYGDRTDGSGKGDRIYALRFSLYGL